MKFHSLNDLDKTDGTVQLQHSGTHTSILVPTPSPTNPNDPLRWPTHKKHVAFASVCAFTFLTNFVLGGLAPAFYILSLEFYRTMEETSYLLLWPVLVLGAFNFFWVPLANYFGRRPVFVFASGLLCACCTWGAMARSFESLLWSRIIAAFAGSSSEAVSAAVVNDLYFLHERGGKTGIYMNAIAGGHTIGPLLCGFVVSNLGWRWHEWISAILTALNFLSIVFFVPETRYQRSDLEVSIPSTLDDAFVTEDVKSLRRVSHESTHQIPKKTFAQELSLWSGTSSTNLFKLFIRPLPLILYPCLIFSFLCYSISLVPVVAVNILNPFVLQAPPYNWSPQINGLINIPGLLGNVFGAWAGGNLVDTWCEYRTKKNRGVFEPESRLYVLVIPFLLTGAGSVLFGYGVRDMLSWVSLFFGYGLISVALTAAPAITVAYVSDCVFPVNSDALMLVNGLKNIVAFGFLHSVVPWVSRAGYVNTFGTMAGIYVAILGLGAVLLIVCGAKVRHVSAQWKLILA